MANLGTLAVIWIGGLQVIGARLTIGELVAFQSYLMMAMFPLFMLGMIIAMVSQAAASADRVFEILDARSEVVEKPDAGDLPPIEGRVIFEEVWFRYFGPKDEDPAPGDGEDAESKAAGKRGRRRRPRPGGTSPDPSSPPRTGAGGMMGGRYGHGDGHGRT